MVQSGLHIYDKSNSVVIELLTGLLVALEYPYVEFGSLSSFSELLIGAFGEVRVFV
jgi:hypothetical protein